MKQKTATIRVYHVFGTKGTVCADVQYRGRGLWQLAENNTPQAMLDKAREWAHANGFTHTKVTYG